MRRPLFALVAVGVLGGALLYWNRNAPRLADRPPEAAARRPASLGDGDVLVVVDGLPREPGAPREWPYAWMNTVFQEFGPCALARARELAAADLVGRRVAIVPAGVHDALGGQARAALREMAEAGGVIVIEAPLGRLPAGFADSAAMALEPVPAGADTSSAWRALGPVLSRLWPRDAAWPPRPAAVGRGAIVVVAAPFARTLVDLQQAGAAPAGATRTGRGLHPSALPQPTSFVPDTALLGLRLPALDGLEHQVGLAMMAAGPLPRLWPAPAAARGGFVVTHDSELMGDRGAWMALASAGRGEPCTYFLADASFTPAGIARLESLGVDLGFHWDRTPTGFRRVGWGPLRAYYRQRSAREQLAGLEAKGFRPGPDGLINRNHYLAMTSPTSHFRQMSALGVTLDSSFGPDVAGYGTPFATQLPYFPLDDNGYPFAFLELPFQYADDFGGADSAAIQGMIRRTAEQDHGTLVALFHPNLFDGRGEVEAFVGWERGYTWAREAGLWVGTMGEMLRFSRHRAGAFLTSAWEDPVLEIAANVKDSLQALSLPLAWKGRALRSARVGNTPAGWIEVERWGEREALVRLPVGAVEVSVEYAAAR